MSRLRYRLTEGLEVIPAPRCALCSRSATDEYRSSPTAEVVHLCSKCFGAWSRPLGGARLGKSTCYYPNLQNIPKGSGNTLLPSVQNGSTIGLTQPQSVVLEIDSAADLRVILKLDTDDRREKK